MNKCIMVVAIVFLGVVDISNTLEIISRGGIEANPVMDYFLQHSVLAFIFTKLAMTCAGLWVLFKHKPSYLIYILIVYIVLIIYQFILLSY